MTSKKLQSQRDALIEKAVRAQKRFRIHFSIYIFWNLAMAIIRYIVWLQDQEFMLPVLLWVSVGIIWGICVFIHYYIAVIIPRKALNSLQDEKGDNRR